MKIGIIGGGNLGSVLAVKFSQKHDVILYTNLIDKFDLYQSDMQIFCEDTNSYIVGNNIKFTTSLKDLVEQSTYIFITYPSFLFESLSNSLSPFLNNNHHLVFVPGSGGAELYFKNVVASGVTITGLQRVHSVARILDFGKLVKESGIKSKLKIASIPSSFNNQAATDLSELYGIKVEKLNCYLDVTFVNSNPILHTSRLYTIFKDYLSIHSYQSLPLFYEEWNDESSNLLIEMDNELFNIIDCLNKAGLNIKGIEPLLQYYESYDAASLSNKLRSITAFKGIGTPSITNIDGTFSPDLASRYFTADFPFGLDILLSFGKTLNLNLHEMEKVSKWYHKITNRDDRFSLQEFSINSIDDIIEFYK